MGAFIYRSAIALMVGSLVILETLEILEILVDA